MQMRHISAFIAVILSFSSTTEAHTKIVCTNVVLDGNGIPASCNGSQSLQSYVNGFQGWEDGRPTLYRKNNDTTCKLVQVEKGQSHLACLDLERAKVCSGVAPPKTEIARVRPGQEVVVAWPKNTHVKSMVSFFWEGRNVPSNGSEPNVYDWMNEKQRIGSYSYETTDMSPNGAPSKSYVYKEGDNWSKLVDSHVGGRSDTILNYQTITLPHNLPVGLNRVLFYYRLGEKKGSETFGTVVREGYEQDYHYFDCMYYWVEGNPVTTTPAKVPGKLVTTIQKRGLPSEPVSDRSYYIADPANKEDKELKWPTEYKITWGNQTNSIKLTDLVKNKKTPVQNATNRTTKKKHS